VAGRSIPPDGAPSKGSKRGRKPSISAEVTLQLVGAAERLKMWGFPDKVAFEAVVAAGWKLFQHRGMREQIGWEDLRRLHKERGHLVRRFFGNTPEDPLPAPPWGGKWPPPQAGRFTKESRARLNPWPDLKPERLAALVLRGDARPPIGVYVRKPNAGWLRYGWRNLCWQCSFDLEDRANTAGHPVREALELTPTRGHEE